MNTSSPKFLSIISLVIYILLSFGNNSVSAANAPIECTPDLQTYQCAVCFDNGFIYEGKEKTSLSDIAINNGSLRNVYFADENASGSIELKNRGESAVVYTKPIFDYHTDFFTLNRIRYPSYTTWAPMVHPNGLTKWATIIDPKSPTNSEFSYKWTQTLSGKELFVTSIDKAKINDSNRSLIRDANFVTIYKLKTWFRNTTTKSWEGSDTHIECQVTGAHFCGDGYVEPGREVCDDGGENGQPGKCNTSCDTITQGPSCDSLSAVPLFGDSPLSTSLTCNGSNLPVSSTYAIDCGNGTQAIMNGNVGVCNYINNSKTDSKTYTPKCIINGSVTSKACNDQLRIGVNPPPNPPVCNPTKTGTQISTVNSSDILCNVGTTSGFVSSGSNPINYGWTCNNAGKSVSCSATYTPPVTPVCNPAKSGAQTNPVLATDALCTTGTASGFVANGTNPVNYTWSCNTTTSVSCSASYTPSVPPADFDLRIKKYAKSEDIFASVDKTENFNYTIVVENVGTGKTSGVTTVTDKLPPSVTLRATPSGNGWTCTGNAGDVSFTCTTNAVVDAHQLFNVITVPTKVTNLTFRPDGYVNYAYVQNPNEADGKQCNADNSMPNPALAGDNGQDPTKVCNEDKNNFDPATINPPNPNGFDLRVKKFIQGDDNSAMVIPGSVVDYTFVLQNLGELASTGRTIVTDQDFPAGITIDSIATTQGEWTCVQDTSIKFTCTSDKSYAKGEYATTILVKTKIPVTLPLGNYRNIACLINPNDPNNGQVFDPDTGKYIVNNCDPAVAVVVNPSTFDLRLKKYVADTTSGTPERDGDHQTSNDGTDVDRDILTVPQGGKVRYRFVVTNLGPVTATGTTTVEDTLPNDVSITSVSGTGWNCTQDGNRKFKCTRTENLAMGVSFPQITIDADVSSTILAGEYSNTATLSNPGDTNPNNNQDPANIQIVVPGFDLSVKKYVNTDANDAQDSANAFSTTTNALINYIIRVKNNGPLSTSGATTIKDVLPTGVSASGSASGTGWLCSYSGAELTCITSQVVASGAVFSDITVPVKVTLSEGQSVANYAVVYNPNETNACKVDGSMPVGDETSCGKDPRNIDPAVIKVGGCIGCCGGVCPPPISYVRKTCFSTLPCAGYQTYDLCVQAGKDAGYTDSYARARCHPADATGIAACNADIIPSCGGSNCGNGSKDAGELCDYADPAKSGWGIGGCDGSCKPVNPTCGNGIPETGEECDTIGDTTCSSSCKKIITTNPGKCSYGVALTIPKLTYAIRSPLIDLIPGQITHRVVVGPNTNVFTLADEIKMNVTNQECDLPIAIKGDDEICITSLLSDLVNPSGPGISKTTLCKTVAEIAPSRVDADGYVRMGKGEYAVYNGGTVTIKTVRNSADPIMLFKGANIAKQYIGGTTSLSTLRDAFKGLPTALPNATGSLLITKNNPVLDPTGFSDFGRIDVRVSGTMLGSTTSVINRRVEDYLVKPTDILSTFLTAFQINGTTTTAGNTTTTTTAPTVRVPTTSVPTGIPSLQVTKVADLLPYNLNGNQNIFSIKGNVAIECPLGSNIFSLSLVRTLIVEGNLTIKCNIAYEADTGASWAFIVKNGNIIIDKSVTNLAGVYVAIKKEGELPGNDCTIGVGNTGLFCPQNGATNAILKVDGSMYGNAKPLFDSRLYVRGTSAYDILTTGVIMGYSNRALVNPPPLLSEYLNNYSVTKVTK